MKNNRGLTVQDRIKESFEIAKEVNGNNHDRKAFALRAIGVADFALEFGLITFDEWEQYLSEFFLIE